jgi:hypothetical protein
MQDKEELWKINIAAFGIMTPNDLIFLPFWKNQLYFSSTLMMEVA